MMLYSKTIESPVGKLMLVASDKGLRFVGFEKHSGRYAALDGEVQAVESHPILGRAELELMEYFTGQRQVFSVKLDMVGTVFQIKAWRALCAIPYGETRSYGDQARMMGDANKARAVGMANNRNPISIIVPCHRVIGSDGGLTGYGGGLPRKKKLLELEGAEATPEAA